MILSLYHMLLSAFAPFSMATNSALNIGLSTVDFFFEYACTNAVLTQINKHLLCLHGFLSHAWSLSTNMQLYLPSSLQVLEH